VKHSKREGRGYEGEGGELRRTLVRKEGSLWGMKGKIIGENFAVGGKRQEAWSC